jgi:hypothetical protein
MITNFKIAIRISSENSDYFQDVLTIVKDEKKRYLNSFKDSQNKIQASLLSEDLKTEYPINFSKTEKDDGKRVFTGYLERGKSAELGINFSLTISEIYQADTKDFCYGYTIHFSKRPDVTEILDRLFGKVELKPVLQSKGKKK